MRTRSRIAGIGSAALLLAILLATVGFALLHERDDAEATAGSRILRIGLFALLIVALLRPHPIAALIAEMQRSREALGAGVELLAEGLKDRAEAEQRIRALIPEAREQ